ncbi:MAG: DUF2846 domain-containing protein [Verrucomicrobiae bacterium]|nr:DUF2846 domain-containing protein [Verrucomicrobiae bacterium]
MYTRIGLIILALSALSGCASVPMQSSEATQSVKEFKGPANGNAGLYVYRSGTLGAALKKDIWVDGVCLGESAPNVFFFREVKGDMDHNISTESEFSPNELVVKTQSGKNYFVRQYLKLGLFVGGAGLELVDEETGKKEVAELSLASNGVCSR